MNNFRQHVRYALHALLQRPGERTARLRLADRNGLGVLSISLRAERIGARIQQVVRVVVEQGVNPGLIGLALGVTGAKAGSNAIAGLLYEVKPHDPMTFAGDILLLLAVVGTACTVLASRAVRTPPASALRVEQTSRPLAGRLP